MIAVKNLFNQYETLKKEIHDVPFWFFGFETGHGC